MKTNPNPNKYFKLLKQYYLQTDQIYEEQAVKDIKLELQAIHGVYLQKIMDKDYLYYVCAFSSEGCKAKTQNMSSESCQSWSSSSSSSSDQNQEEQAVNKRKHQNHNYNCKYYVKFQIIVRLCRVTLKFKNKYTLMDFDLTHQKNCRDPQQAYFIRNKRYLNMYSPVIHKVVNVNRLFGQQLNSQRTICKLVARIAQLPCNFVQKDIEDPTYLRKLKKKLDNIIGEAKRMVLTRMQLYELQLFQHLFINDLDDMEEETIKANQITTKAKIMKQQNESNLSKTKMNQALVLERQQLVGLPNNQKIEQQFPKDRQNKRIKTSSVNSRKRISFQIQQSFRSKVYNSIDKQINQGPVKNSKQKTTVFTQQKNKAPQILGKKFLSIQGSKIAPISNVKIQNQKNQQKNSSNQLKMGDEQNKMVQQSVQRQQNSLIISLFQDKQTEINKQKKLIQNLATAEKLKHNQQSQMQVSNKQGDIRKQCKQKNKKNVGKTKIISKEQKGNYGAKR